ncbi:hypothetical protein GRI97_06225 [Altererythrobacter xixiisoli]|uniref:DUF995 domain-containing protein n=1 Tax=Croceibacterium xixiisoli TaxID=1476466 RepID=A0A6I4TRQ3_9SPHN|nr:hypothetical protein [Croceibacterium xixiisoli]MXO98582.1 hypothetical protein [Croceibacterium xixiisoli]
MTIPSLISRHVPLLAGLMLASAVPAHADEAPAAALGETTRILDQRSADRLEQNTGLTLQWITWDRRGVAVINHQGDLWKLRGEQSEQGGPGKVELDGVISEIGQGYFTFRGTIRITDTPDKGRVCEQTKDWHFAVTQNRPYYRLREFEWCDGLTDYIDIYF